MLRRPPPDRIVITGPTGWIGQAMLAEIASAAGGRLDGRVTAFGSSARVMALPWGEALDVSPLDSITPADVAGAQIIHLAYLTKEKAETLGERCFTNDNLAIDDLVLDALGQAPTPAAGVFVASSGAAALAASGQDLHPYGLAKLRQEARFLAWGKAAGVPVLAGRIFNIAGPYGNKLESYALSNFIEQGRRKGQIAIAARVPVSRSFLHVSDLCRLVMAALATGVGRSRPVDLCGAEIVEMGDLAQVVSEVLAERLGHGVPITRDTVDYTRPSSYLGQFADTKALAMELGIPLKLLRTQVIDTFAWLSQPYVAAIQAS